MTRGREDSVEISLDFVHGRGSGIPEHQELLLELDGLQRALNEIENLQAGPQQEIEVNAVKVAAMTKLGVEVPRSATGSYLVQEVFESFLESFILEYIGVVDQVGS